MALEHSTVESPAEPDVPDVPDDRVIVRIMELIVGRPLEHPIYDVHGVLLLAAGKTVTSDFKRLLRRHLIERVQVHAQDVKHLRMRSSDPANPSRCPVFHPTESAANLRALWPISTVSASRSTFLSVADYTERQFRALRRILDQIDRCNSRSDPHYGPRRRFERKPYRGAVTVFLPTFDRPDPPPNGQGTFTAWSYSLSQGGMGFVSPSNFDERTVVIGIHLPESQTRWFRGEIVRKRLILGEEFFDYGVQFSACHTAGGGALNEEFDFE